CSIGGSVLAAGLFDALLCGHVLHLGSGASCRYRCSKSGSAGGLGVNSRRHCTTWAWSLLDRQSLVRTKIDQDTTRPKPTKEPLIELSDAFSEFIQSPMERSYSRKIKKA